MKNFIFISIIKMNLYSIKIENLFLYFYYIIQYCKNKNSFKINYILIKDKILKIKY